MKFRIESFMEIEMDSEEAFLKFKNDKDNQVKIATELMRNGRWEEVTEE